MATKEAPTLGTEINKQLKDLVKDLIETDDEVRNVVRGLVLGHLRANPASIQRSISLVLDEELRSRYSMERRELQADVKASIERVAEEVLANVRRVADAELERQIALLKGTAQ